MANFHEYIVDCPQQLKDLKQHCIYLNNVLRSTKELWDICCLENPPYDSKLVSSGLGVAFELGTQIHAGVSNGNYVDESNGCDHRITLFLVKVPSHAQQKLSQLRYETTEMPWGLIVDIKISQILEAQSIFEKQQFEDRKQVDEKEYCIVAFALQKKKMGYFLVYIQDMNHCVYMKMSNDKHHFITDYEDNNYIPIQSIACKGKLDSNGCLTSTMILDFCDCVFVQSITGGNSQKAYALIEHLLSDVQQKMLM